VLLPDTTSVERPLLASEPPPETVPASVWPDEVATDSTPSVAIAPENVPPAPTVALPTIARVLPAPVSNRPLQSGLAAASDTLPVPSAASVPVPDSAAVIV